MKAILQILFRIMQPYTTATAFNFEAHNYGETADCHANAVTCIKCTT